MAAPSVELFDAFPGIKSVSVPMGEVVFRVNNMDPYERYVLRAIAKQCAPARVFEAALSVRHLVQTDLAIYVDAG